MTIAAAEAERTYPGHHIDTHTQVSVGNYVFEVYSHSRDKSDRTLDDVVLSLLEDKAIRTFAGKHSKR
jgi:hypothetical protein